MSNNFFYNYSIWLTGVIFLGTLLVALEFGYWMGRWWQKRTPEHEKGTGDIVMTAMYGLLGLVLAFTYSFTISHADNRKQAVIAEANALGTAFLRADVVPEPSRTELQRLLRDYAKTRVITHEIVSSPEDLNRVIKNSLNLQAQLWPVTVRIVETSGRGPIEVSIIQSINEVIDMHTIRIAASFDRLPSAVLSLLLFIASIALAVSGYNRGLLGTMNRIRMTALALVLATVVFTITDFDRSMVGFVRQSQQPLINVIADMDTVLSSKPEVPGT